VELYLLLFALLAIALAIAWRFATRASRASAQRNARARRGEDAAERLLERSGFTILERQATRRWSFEVDGELHVAGVRADLLVTRNERLFVAEVKTGSLAPNPCHPATRRQLLEYWFVYEPDGLLLVDMERCEVREVCFPFS